MNFLFDFNLIFNKHNFGFSNQNINRCNNSRTNDDFNVPTNAPSAIADRMVGEMFPQVANRGDSVILFMWYVGEKPISIIQQYDLANFTMQLNASVINYCISQHFDCSVDG